MRRVFRCFFAPLTMTTAMVENTMEYTMFTFLVEFAIALAMMAAVWFCCWLWDRWDDRK